MSTEAKVALPALLTNKIIVLRLYINDFDCIDTKLVQTRDMRQIKRIACEYIRANEKIVSVVLTGLTLDGSLYESDVAYNINHAKPWWVDHKIHFQDDPTTERYATKREAMKRYQHYRSMDMISDTNALTFGKEV